MDKEKVLELAQEAELARQFALEVPFVVDRLERFAALITQHERERCAQIADAFAEGSRSARTIAEEIRKGTE